MGEGKLYKVEIATPAKIRYQQRVLSYLYENFSFDRATEIDEAIIGKAKALSKQPRRGRDEDYLSELDEAFKFILYKETKYFEVKIIYYIDEEKSIVYVTDFFPTRMSPQKISEDHN